MNDRWKLLDTPLEVWPACEVSCPYVGQAVLVVRKEVTMVFRPLESFLLLFLHDGSVVTFYSAEDGIVSYVSHKGLTEKQISNAFNVWERGFSLLKGEVSSHCKEDVTGSVVTCVGVHTFKEGWKLVSKLFDLSLNCSFVVWDTP